MQRSALGDIAFLRRAIAQAFAGSPIQHHGDAGAFALGQLLHAGALGEILANEAIGVLVRAKRAASYPDIDESERNPTRAFLVVDIGSRRRIPIRRVMLHL